MEKRWKKKDMNVTLVEKESAFRIMQNEFSVIKDFRVSPLIFF